MPGNWGRLTIHILPDDVLEIFEIYIVDDDNVHRCQWHTLVHVCRRWRSVVETLDIWPALPIIIGENFGQFSRSKGASNIIAALKHPDRVRRIHLNIIPLSVLNRFAAAMKNPFPALTDLWLDANSKTAPVLPDSFLGGSAPRLRKLWLGSISFPALTNLQ
ncbi:hypothetical protein BC826DRAFT_1107581 [Russula brevipes]|nr:hypothetical protein BC826DRAFT_1107581 [Russula brevipes]